MSSGGDLIRFPVGREHAAPRASLFDKVNDLLGALGHERLPDELRASSRTPVARPRRPDQSLAPVIRFQPNNDTKDTEVT